MCCLLLLVFGLHFDFESKRNAQLEITLGCFTVLGCLYCFCCLLLCVLLYKSPVFETFMQFSPHFEVGSEFLGFFVKYIYRFFFFVSFERYFYFGFFTFISFSAICLLLLDIWITIMFYKYLEKLENVVPNGVRLAHVSLKGCSFRCLLLENFEVLKESWKQSSRL